MDLKTINDINSKTWDRWATDRGDYSSPISHETFLKAQQGYWDVTIAADRPVPKDWFPELKDAKVLGLASGGGQQCPIFVALGANVTVLDNSEKQLQLEKEVADRENYNINLIKGDMTDLSVFEDETFDLVFNPVSTPYIRDVIPVWKEVYRVLKKGGIFLTGLNNPMSFIFANSANQRDLIVKSKLPFDPVSDLTEEELNDLINNNHALFFSHSLETLLGGQMKAGFRLLDLIEDYDKYDELSQYTPIYFATKAIKE
ncbi:MAG: class I SAM-dependent methyltransferase [Candidatus Cloacimonetes bacterium]|nr:class I SAM-dependent methyltransferase [Candidatus Cloacimonadota bacterium]